MVFRIKKIVKNSECYNRIMNIIINNNAKFKFLESVIVSHRAMDLLCREFAIIRSRLTILLANMRLAKNGLFDRRFLQ